MNNLNIQGRFQVGGKGKVYKNQVTYAGSESIAESLIRPTSPKVTNLLLLTNFVMPSGKTKKELTFADIEPYINASMGNNSQVNEDDTRDLRVYISGDAPYEATFIGTVPTNRGNLGEVGKTFNAAVLITGGDELQSITQTEDYVSLGSEKIFSIVEFDAQQKSVEDSFVSVWHIAIVV